MVLIVDDEVELAKMTCEYFRMFDVPCDYVESGSACLAYIKANRIDILLLDINLREESGFDLCKKIREDFDLPILFTSARQSDDNVLIALNIGGDDYIKKPYSLGVLLAKVKIMQKRMSSSQGHSTVAKCGIIVLDESTMRVSIADREVALKAREFQLLKCLFENRNTIVTKDKLLNTVWGDAFYSNATLNVHIRKLREKMEKDPNEPVFIKTIWGTGYMLEIGD